MIKGSFLMSLLLKRFARKSFKSGKRSDPMQDPWTDKSFPVRPFNSSCNIWRQRAFGRFKDYSFKNQEQRRVAVGPGNAHFISIRQVSSDGVRTVAPWTSALRTCAPPGQG